MSNTARLAILLLLQVSAAVALTVVLNLTQPHAGVAALSLMALGTACGLSIVLVDRPDG